MLVQDLCQFQAATAITSGYEVDSTCELIRFTDSFKGIADLTCLICQILLRQRRLRDEIGGPQHLLAKSVTHGFGLFNTTGVHGREFCFTLPRVLPMELITA